MKATVLLIDDDPLDLKPLQMLLEGWNLEVVTVRSGKAGLERLKSLPVDLIISDVRMPGLSGEEVLQNIRQNFPWLPVILITGKHDVQSAVNAMKMGAFDYILKPPDQTEFRLVIDRALEHSRLHRENTFLKSELAAGGMYGERLIGRSEKMLAVFDMINRTARTDSTVLITGETGTGKELVAQTIHYKSHRAQAPLVALNCASLNPNLIESELFGHEKGAFTSAVAARRGRFEDANGGTLFLDEIGKTSLEFQAKLLRVLQEGELERVGGNERIQVDVRLVTSSNKDLQSEVAAGTFREDLFYRLCVIPIHLPPLRERPEDIPLLAEHFATTYGSRYRQHPCTISDDALAYLRSLEWHGNVRELQHAIERAVVLSERDTLEPDDFQRNTMARPDSGHDDTLQAVLDRRTREHLIEVLDETGWHKRRAAEQLGIDRVTLYRMLKKYGITGKG